jgi:hypothetical protein
LRGIQKNWVMWVVYEQSEVGDEIGDGLRLDGRCKGISISRFPALLRSYC